MTVRRLAANIRKEAIDTHCAMRIIRIVRPTQGAAKCTTTAK